MPANMPGYGNIRTFATYALPISKIKSNLNFNAGIVYTRTPARINNRTNIASSYSANAGFVLSGNISEKTDFTLSYSSHYVIVENTAVRASDNNYFYHTASVRIKKIVGERLVLSATADQALFNGLADTFDQQYTLVNTAIGYKLLTNKLLEVSISVFDLLNQNNNIARNVTETYIEDSRNNVLNRYVMASLTYTFKHFGDRKIKENN